MVRALYPGTFDPIHNGHADIAYRAAAIFDEVVLGIYHSPPKKLLFSTDQRVALAKEAMADRENISVVRFSGLTVECARQVDANVIVRGLRNVADYQFEAQIGLANRNMAPDIELCCLICSTDYTYLSSTIVKEVAGLEGDVSDWVMPHVAKAMKAEFDQRSDVDMPEVTQKSKGVSQTRGKMSRRG